MNIEELTQNFELLEDWEDKYRYLIELGNALEPLQDEYKNDSWMVLGCQSQVWLVPEVVEQNGVAKISFKGDSDAIIVKGLISVVISIFSGRTVDEIKNIAVDKIFADIGLQEHLSPSRRNGLHSMVEKIKLYAGGI